MVRSGPSLLSSMPAPGNPTQPPPNPISSLLTDLRERLLQNPGDLQAILQELQTTNPELYQMIQQNPQIVQNVIMNPSRPPPPPAQPRPQFTAEERAAIDRVCLRPDK